MKIFLTIILVIMFAPMLFGQETLPTRMYPFSMDFDPTRTLILSIPSPSGFERYPTGKMTRYMAWLTNLPLKRENHPLLRYDGQKIRGADSITAVIDLSVANANQKNADIPVQLTMEYLKIIGKLDDFFYLLEDDSLSFGKWMSGKYAKNSRGKIFYTKGDTRENNLTEYYRYIEFLMRNSGAKSLQKNLDLTDQKSIVPGDIFIAFDSDDVDSTGFVAIILDVAMDADGNIKVLPAWGGNPASSFHIPKPEPPKARIWFTLKEFLTHMTIHGEGSFYRYTKLINL